MEPSNQRAEALIQRLKKNECTPEELLLLRKWIMNMELAGPENGLSPELLTELKTRMHDELMQKIRATPVVTLQPHRMARRMVAAAAVLVMMVSGAAVWYLLRRSAATDQSVSQELTVIENNKKNIVQQITLPDGTLVWLNRHSRLEFDAKRYNGHQRYVKLSGEGYFEVVSNAAKPFVVETGKLQTRVLGTAFNIEAYQQESEIRVSLVNGKVALNDTISSRTTFLLPNQTLRYSKAAGTWQVVPMAVNNIASWVHGDLVFNEVPLEEAIQRIEEHYQVTIQYDAELLRDKRITVTVTAGTWASALQNILFVHGLEYKEVQNRIMIVKP